MTSRMRIPGTPGHRCRCGGVADLGAIVCRKCLARYRWRRRKAPYPGEEDVTCS
ncbi:hypothetical protein [Herbidospora sp. RD11066]